MSRKDERLRPRYLQELLRAYQQAPETPHIVKRDREDAGRLYDRGVPLSWALGAIHLVILRRAVRPHDLPPLDPIRSLRYFLTALEELELYLRKVDVLGYLEYLEDRYRRYRRAAWPPPPRTTPPETTSSSTEMRTTRRDYRSTDDS